MPPWLHHLPLDPESEELTEWFRLLLSSKHGLTNILALSGKDAKLFIEIVDRVRFPKMFLDLLVNSLPEFQGIPSHELRNRTW